MLDAMLERPAERNRAWGSSHSNRGSLTGSMMGRRSSNRGSVCSVEESESGSESEGESLDEEKPYLKYAFFVNKMNRCVCVSCVCVYRVYRVSCVCVCVLT